MSNPAIFLPVAALVFWTLAILALHSFTHGRGASRNDASRVGESAPAVVDKTIANRNYINLLELPVLF